jgi:hypothetical protein
METIVHDFLLSLSSYGASAKIYFESHVSWLGPAVLGIFTLINSLRVLAYIPQIVRAARDTGGASAVSIMTWALFLLSHLTTIAYAVVCIGDLVMALIFFGNAMACVAIVGITLMKRRCHAAAAPAGGRPDRRPGAALRNN